jgi:hypothetical protein
MPTVLKGMFQDRISVGQSELLTGAVVKTVCKSELTFNITLYFIHLQQLVLPSLVLVTLTNIDNTFQFLLKSDRNSGHQPTEIPACLFLLAIHLAERNAFRTKIVEKKEKSFHFPYIVSACLDGFGDK